MRTYIKKIIIIKISLTPFKGVTNCDIENNPVSSELDPIGLLLNDYFNYLLTSMSVGKTKYAIIA